MSLIRIKDFGNLGGNVDRQTTLVEPGVWSTLDNIDIESGDIRSGWGDTEATATPPCEPKYIYRFDGLNQSWVICSDGTEVFAYGGTTWIDITPTVTVTTTTTWQDLLDEPFLWQDLLDEPVVTWGDLANSNISPLVFAGDVSFTTFGGILVVCPSQGHPVYWEDEAGRLKPLPGWAPNSVAKQIVAYTNHLVAIALDDGSTEGAKFRVAWSDAAAEGEIPQSWDFADPTILAGSVQLRDTPGFLTTAELLRNDLIIYKADTIYRMFLRGDELVMGFERVISDHGCDSWRGVARLGDVHFFADAGDIRVFDGQVTRSITEFRIKEQLQVAISNDERDKTFVVANPDREEIWVGIVPAGSDTFDLVPIYSLSHDAWTMKSYPATLSMTMGHLSHIGPEIDTWQDLHDKGITWEMWTDTWGSSLFDPSERGITFGVSGMIFQADKSHTDRNGAPKHCTAERRGFMLADLPQRVTVRAVYPEMEGSATVQIQVGAQWHPGDSVRWTLPQDFRPGIDRKLNVRITGQPTALRVTSHVADGWRLGALSLDITEAGRR